MNFPAARPPRTPLWVLAIFMAAFLWLAPLFWQQVETAHEQVGHAYENSGLYQFIYPAFQWSYARLAGGELPLWNPHQLCGTPVLGHPHIGIFQPLNAVFLFAPTGDALAIHAFLCLVLLGGAMLLLGRALRLSGPAAGLAALAFTFSGATAAVMSRPALASGLVWGTLWIAMLAACRDGRGRSCALAAGLALGMLLLSGAYALTLTWVLAAVVCSLGLPKPAETDPSVPPTAPQPQRLIWALAAGILLGAAQWGPSLLRAPGWAEPLGVLLSHPAAGECPGRPGLWLAQTLACKPGLLPRMPYVGVATLILWPAAWLHPRHRRLAWALTLLAGGSVAFLVLGGARLPGGPALAHSAAFCVAVLAGLGADMFCAKPYSRPAARWGGGLACVVVAAALFVVGGPLLQGYLAVITLILCVALLLPFRYVVAGCVLAWAALLYVDLTIANVNGFRHPLRDSPQWHEEQREALEEAATQAGMARFALAAEQTDFAFPANAGLLFGLRMAGGAHWPLTREQAAWWRALGVDAGEPAWTVLREPPPLRPLLDFMAVRVVAAAPNLSQAWEQAGASGLHGGAAGEHRLAHWTNAQALPRAYWTPEAVGASALQAIELIAEEDFPRDRQCVVSQSRYLSPAGQAGQATRLDASCTVEETSPEQLSVRVEAPEGGWLVLLDAYDAGWTADVNGQWARVYRANGLFRAVRTPAGRSTVTFHYRPVGAYVSLGASLLGLAGLLAWGLAGGLRRRA